MSNIDEAKWRAIQEGYDAFNRGATLNDNPYKPRDPCKRAWSRGWKEGQHHRWTKRPPRSN